MKKLIGLLSVVCLTFTLVGCGGSKEATSTVDRAGADAIAEYQAALEAEQQAMSTAPPTQ